MSETKLWPSSILEPVVSWTDAQNRTFRAVLSKYRFIIECKEHDALGGTKWVFANLHADSQVILQSLVYALGAGTFVLERSSLPEEVKK